MTDRPGDTPDRDESADDTIDFEGAGLADHAAQLDDDLAADEAPGDGAEELEAEEPEVDDYEAAVSEVTAANAAPGTAPAAIPPPTPGQRRGAAPAPPRGPTASELAVHVREDVSKVFVLVAVGVFVLILLNGLLLGSGGLLAAKPTPSPSPSPSASASASASAPASAGPSASAPASEAPSPAASASPSP